MKYEVSLSGDGTYVLIRVRGAMTRELGRRCGKDAVRMGAEHGLRRFLFDLRDAPNIENILSNYQFAYKDMADFGFDRQARSALLTNPSDRSHDFIETAFRNAGYDVRIFSDEESAVAWLAR